MGLEMGETHCVVQAGLKPFAWSNPPTSASQRAGITDMIHDALAYFYFIIFNSFETRSHSVTQAGVHWCDLGSLQPPSWVQVILLPQPPG